MAGLIKRGNTYYALYYQGQKQKRVSLETDSLQLAKEKVRQLETSLYQGGDNPFPTKTPIGTAVKAYIENMETRKTETSVKRDVSNLRESFGPVCPALELKNVKNSEKRKSKKSKKAVPCLEVRYLEELTTGAISKFIADQVRIKGLAPKTANRYREVLTRLINWSMDQNGIRMPGGKNPAAKVERYQEGAPVITFLTLSQIDEQLCALNKFPDLQVMVAVYIYAGLRREELCWLTVDDVDLSAGAYGMLRIQAKTVNGEFWQPKTKVNRVVPISSTLRKYLDKYVRTEVDGGWYFSTGTGCRWDPDNLSGELSEANAKVKVGWTCLDFRHTFGSQLAMKGESLYKIATLMGNSPEICRKHYAALLPESLIASVEFGASESVAPATPSPVAPALPPETVADVRERPRLRLVVNK